MNEEPTPMFDAVKWQQDVRFMAECIAELCAMGVDMTEREDA